MEFHEIPERVRAFLVECDDCWVTAAKHRSTQPRPQVELKRRSLRQTLWELSGREPQPDRRLTPQCGNRNCHRPEHQRPSSLIRNDRSMARRHHSRKQRVQVRERFELAQAVRALEVRGFVRDTRKKGAMSAMTYRVGLGKGRSSAASKANGPWWVYWQEPLRVAGSKAERRKAA